MNPLVSIIIPFYNRALSITKMLQSISSQSYLNWECILVDDESTDATEEIILEYIAVTKDTRFQYYKRPDSHEPGGNGARNYGFEISKGNYINWVDSDDILHPDFIKEKVNTFDKETNCDVVISKTILTRSNVNEVIKYEDRTKLSDNLIEDFITLKISWYTFDPMWKRSFLERQEELFNEQLLKGQDRDFHIRMLLHNPKIQIVDKYLYYYVVTSQDSISLKNSEKVAWSMFLGNTKRNQILLSKKKVSISTKLMLLKQQIKLYPNLYKKKDILKKYNQEIKLLFVLNLQNIIWLVKFGLAIISFKIIGKGEKILR
ncbi:glycosyltransferase family 2 protein [Flavobacterium sp. U410]